jgi:putative DNA primase/helicase
MLALMTDPITREPCGVHRTFLDSSARKLERKMLGKQGVIRICPDADVTEGLGICEGIEDALAIRQCGWCPIWAATCAGAIARFSVLPGVQALTIFTDIDAAGSQAARRCSTRWRDAGRDVAVVLPQRYQ